MIQDNGAPIKKNRISGIEADGGDERVKPDRTSLKRNLFILASIAAVSAVIILLVTKVLYKQPSGFLSETKTEGGQIFEGVTKQAGLDSANIHIIKGKASYAKGYYADATTEFNEALESESSDKDKAIALIYLGMISDDKSDFKKAVEYYLKALKYDNSNPIIYRNISLAYRKLKDYDKAIEYAKESLSRDGDNPDSHILIGNIYFEMARYKDAIQRYEVALKFAPDNAALLYNMGAALMKTGDQFSAAEYFKKAASSDKIGEIAHRAYSKLGVLFTEMGSFDLAEKYLKQAVSVRPNDPVNRYNLGIAYLRQKKNELAIEEFIKAEEFGAKDALMLENLGDAYSALKDYDRSISAFQRLLDVNSRNVRILSRVAEIYYEKGELDKALAAFGKVTMIEPATENARIAYLNMGNILDDAGRFDEAIEAYNKALAINPKDSDAYYNLGLAYKHADKPELAVQSWKKGSDLNRDDPKNLIAVADFYYEKNMFDLAEREYETAIARWPNIQEPHFKISSIYYKREKYEFALKGFKKAAEIDPKSDYSRRAFINIGMILSKIKTDEDSLTEAVNYIQKSLMLKSNDSEALFALGIIYYRKDMHDRAIESFLQCVRTSKDSSLTAEAYNNIGKCHYKRREYKRALQNFSRAVEENPSKEEFRINRKTASEAYEAQIAD